VLIGFGFYDGYTMFDTTWVYTGSSWALINTSPRPPGRRGVGFAFDTVRGVAVLFGGESPNPSVTWEYDSLLQSWTEIFPTVTPGFRNGPALAYDPVRQVTVSFGGNGANSYGMDTWEYDGAEWTMATPVHSPVGRNTASMTYHAAIGRMVLFGAPGFSDTWEWDGTDWVETTPAQSPPAGRIYIDYVPELRAVIGTGGDGVVQRMWMYRYESAWPDEQCDSGVDDDLDGLVDCADPDCDGRPCSTGWCEQGSCQ
jgi:hypothetical protein